MKKLYFHPLSGNSRRVLLTAAHLGVTFEPHVVDLTKRAQREPAYLRVNPNGRVPTLEDDGLVLWESRAIMIHLCETTPGQTLYPGEPRARADVNRWLFWCSGHMAPAQVILVQENFVKPMAGAPTSADEIARGENLFHEHASQLDRHLAGRTWVAGDRLSLADFSLAAGLALAGPAKMPVAAYENVLTWFGRVQQLDAWKRTAPALPGRP